MILQTVVLLYLLEVGGVIVSVVVGMVLCYWASYDAWYCVIRLCVILLCYCAIGLLFMVLQYIALCYWTVFFMVLQYRALCYWTASTAPRQKCIRSVRPFQ